MHLPDLQMDLAQLAQQTREVYNRNATAFDTQRAKKLYERKWLDAFTSKIPEGGRILDLGCGAGEPISAYFIQQGYQVIGTDFSEAMLSIAKDRFPENDWFLADMRSLSLDQSFDGIIGWNSFFHLNQTDQRTTLPILANHLRPAGILLLTVGPEAGEVTGHVNGELVYHASLSLDEYTSILDEAGLDVIAFVAEDEECDGQSVLIAQKRT